MAKGFGKKKKQEKKNPLVVGFEYEVKGITSDDHNVSQSGKSELIEYIDEDDYIDSGILFEKALSSTMEHFYSFEVEKQGYTDISEVTITIKNLRVNH